MTRHMSAEWYITLIMTDIIFIWPPLGARILVFKPRLCSNNYGVDTTCQTCHTRLTCTGGLLCLQHTDTTCVIIYYQIYFKHIWLSNKVLKVRMFYVPSPGLAQWLTQSDHGISSSLTWVYNFRSWWWRHIHHHHRIFIVSGNICNMWLSQYICDFIFISRKCYRSGFINLCSFVLYFNFLPFGPIVYLK